MEMAILIDIKLRLIPCKIDRAPFCRFVLFPATTTDAAAAAVDAVLVEADEYELAKRDDDDEVDEALDDGRVRSSSSSPSLL